MLTIAALGPENTFSELAAIKYGKESGDRYEIKLFPTMTKVFAAVGSRCSCAVLPIENLAEGYVTVVLDLLINNPLSVIHEVLLPIQFSLAANCASLDNIKKIYSQFITQGQCEKFLDKIDNAGIITTESNGSSLEQLKKRVPDEAAIVPAFSVKPGDFPLMIPNIADRSNNQTRFITVAPKSIKYDPSKEYKTSILIVESVDRPGMLSDILSAFASRKINLVSIMSRPTKEMMGQYHFFIDLEGYSEEPHVREALSDIMKENTIRILGSYPVAYLKE
ncbi:MAG: ACT domain-containing protein [Spirochaetes bacterium]|nr:ACT domain-containing protein [Spirochaetota bacterium]